MNNIQELKASAGNLVLIHTRDDIDKILHSAEQKECSYLDFLQGVLNNEIKYCHDKAMDKRIKEAGFPYSKSLIGFDLDFCRAVTKRQLNQLSELTWIDGLYNLIHL